jgi:energy-coupling factor transport system substrate-specific component
MSDALKPTRADAIRPYRKLRADAIRPYGNSKLTSFALLSTLAIGAVAFIWPLWGGGADSLLVFTLLAGLALFVALAAAQGQELNSKGLALLAILTALNASLRLLPSFAGASPIFFLLIVAGFVFGASFGFLFGTLTLFVSAIITGGVGPWLPYQMLVAAWVGMSAGWLGGLAQRGWGEAKGPAVLALLAAFGAAWGLLYGALLNLWFWPASADFASVPGSGLTRLGGLAQSYASFYLLTSLPYDLWRSILNVIMIITLGGAILKVLYRFRRRFYFKYEV